MLQIVPQMDLYLSKDFVKETEEKTSTSANQVLTMIFRDNPLHLLVRPVQQVNSVEDIKLKLL